MMLTDEQIAATSCSICGAPSVMWFMPPLRDLDKRPVMVFRCGVHAPPGVATIAQPRQANKYTAAHHWIDAHTPATWPDLVRAAAGAAVVVGLWLRNLWRRARATWGQPVPLPERYSPSWWCLMLLIAAATVGLVAIFRSEYEMVSVWAMSQGR